MNYNVLYIILSFLLFSGFSYVISWFFSRDYMGTKPKFLLADRKLGLTESSFSIAASWIWAPSLFVSALQAYVYGWVGLFWFCVPNLFALILFALLVNKIVNKFPQGYTLSEYMGNVYSFRVQSLYWVGLIGLTLGAFATQILAGSKFISMVSDINYFWASVFLTLIPISYSIYFGLKSSVVTDYTKIILLYVVGIVMIPLTIFYAGGFDVLGKGVNGVTKGYTSLIDQNGWTVFATFGLPTAIGLLSGPFGDQAFWQRAFSIDKEYRQKSFLFAACLFIIVPLSMGLLGFAAAGMEFIPKVKQFVNFELVSAMLGTFGIILFSVIVISSITSILDSKLCAVSSISGHDIASKFNIDSLLTGKVSMIILASVAFLIANIPGIELIHLFLIYGALRSSTLLPTIMTMLCKNKLSERGVFYGILLSMLLGIPVFAYGLLNNILPITLIGSIGGVLLPGISILFFNTLEKYK